MELMLKKLQIFPKIYKIRKSSSHGYKPKVQNSNDDLQVETSLASY